MTYNADPVRGPMVGARRWIKRKGYVLGGSKRKTKRREQREAKRHIDGLEHEGGVGGEVVP